jgi:DNA-binding response OmpR family regulator
MALMVLTIGLATELHGKIRELLESQGAVFRSASGFGDGLRLLRENPIDIVLVDLDTVGVNSAISNLADIRTNHPEVGRMMIVNEPTVELLLDSINTAGVDQVFTGEDDPNEISAKLRIELGLDVELPVKPGAPVMVVEKDAEIRKALKSALASWGFHVDAIESGTEALKQMRTVDYKAILANRNIPYLMGWTLVEFIKRNVKYRHIPIIMLTDLSEAEAEADVKEKEIDSYLRLPLVEPALRRKLADVLRGK